MSTAPLNRSAAGKRTWERVGRGRDPSVQTEALDSHREVLARGRHTEVARVRARSPNPELFPKTFGLRLEDLETIFPKVIFAPGTVTKKACGNNTRCHTCRCKEIQSMWKHRFGCSLPMAGGHIFFTNDDYCGPCKNVFEVSSKCVATSTKTQAMKSNNKLLSKLRYTIGEVTFRLTGGQLDGA